jgi:hypothetical protein
MFNETLSSGRTATMPQTLMPRRVSDQEEFATNLKGKAWGGSRSTALYQPIQFLEHTGRVGDVAFFDSDGQYTWLHNASHSEVGFHDCASLPVGVDVLRRSQGHPASQQCLGRNTRPIGTLSPDQFRLDNGHFHSPLMCPVRDIFPHGAGADDNYVIRHQISSG